MKMLAVARNEIVGRLRSEPPHLTLAAAVAAMTLSALLAVWLANAISPPFPPDVRSSSLAFLTRDTSWQRIVVGDNKAEAMHFILSLLLLSLGAILGPLAGWASLNRRREGAEVEGLLSLAIDPLEIVGGRLLASVGRASLVAAGTVPALSIAWLYGGVPLRTVVATGTMCAAAIFVGAAFGQAMSLAFGGSTSALLYTYAVLALLGVAGPALVIYALVSGGASDWLPLAFSSPPVTLLAAHKNLALATTTLLPAALQSLAGYYDPVWHGLTPAHLYLLAALAANAAVTAILAAFSAVLIDPLHAMRSFPLGLSRRRA